MSESNIGADGIGRPFSDRNHPDHEGYPEWPGINDFDEPSDGPVEEPRTSDGLAVARCYQTSGPCKRHIGHEGPHSWAEAAHPATEGLDVERLGAALHAEKIGCSPDVCDPTPALYVNVSRTMHETDARDVLARLSSPEGPALDFDPCTVCRGVGWVLNAVGSGRLICNACGGSGVVRVVPLSSPEGQDND